MEADSPLGNPSTPKPPHGWASSSWQVREEVQMELTLVLVAVVALINVAASVAVLRASAFAPSERSLQLALIWLVPVLGAIICMAFASSQALGPASPSTLDPLYLPSDGGAPEGSGTGLCGCGGGDGGGGDGD